LSVGKHHGGTIVDVHVGDQLLQVYAGRELIKAVPRATKGETHKKRLGGTLIPTNGVSSITEATTSSIRRSRTWQIRQRPMSMVALAVARSTTFS
jgi:hypothetical protein